MLMISATASSTTVSAANGGSTDIPGSGGTGSSDTARKKEVWSIFSECLAKGWTDDANFIWDSFGNVYSSYGLTSNSLKSGKWFSGTVVGVQSPYTEKLVTGGYGDGKLRCNEEDKVLSTAISTLGINQKDIICNPANNYQDNGMLNRVNTDSSCGNVYESGGSGAGDTFLTVSPNTLYLNNIIAEVFSDEVPAGSVKELTSVEHYFVLYDSFMAICANGEGSKYTIKEVSGGKLVEKSYDGQYNRKGEYKYFYDKKDTCQGMASALKDSKYVDEVQKYLDNGGAEDEKEAEDSKANSGEVEKNCQNQGGAGALGWIVCTILDWMQRTTDKMYTGVVEPALVVNKSFFEGNTVYDAWTIFRDISNIIFIILLLVVIFSQVTGVGIDNYGIKKILPKLIIAAVLVNLSYWICLVCVDISNILGAGFQDFFDGIPVTVDPVDSVTIAVEDGSVVINRILSTGLVAVTVVGAAASAIAIVANPALLLTLFVSVLGVLIAVLFMFILLAGRKAAIILLMIFSPVAFVLYLLPNTKKLFDKWLKLWQGMLLVYPIAGLLIGGGNFASRIMLNIPGGGATTIFTAMIVGIIPIFFIPTVLKGSFSAMGSIGGAIAGAGNRMRSGATRRMRNSEPYKNLQAAGQRRRIRVKAGRDKDGNLTGTGRVKARIAQKGLGKVLYGKTFARYSEAAEKYRQEDIQAASTIDSSLVQSELASHPEKTPASIYNEKLEEAVKKKKPTSDIFAIIDAAKSAGVKPTEIAKMTRKHLGGDSIPGMSPGDRSNFLRQFANRYGNDFLKKDYEQKAWAMAGGMGYSSLAEKAANPDGKNQTAQGLDGYAGNNFDVDEMKDEDVAALSTENLAKLIEMDKISSTQAQRVWASNSNMDDANRLVLGAYGASDGSTKLSKDDAKKALAGDYGSTGLNKGMVTAYTRRAAQSTVIEDVKIRNVKDGSGRQSNPLETTNSSGSYEWGDGTGSSGGS